MQGGAPQTEYAELKDETLAVRMMREALAARPPRSTLAERMRVMGPRIVYETMCPDDVEEALQLGFAVYVAERYSSKLWKLHKGTKRAVGINVHFYMAAPELPIRELLSETNTKSVDEFRATHCFCFNESDTFDAEKMACFIFRT